MKFGDFVLVLLIVVGMVMFSDSFKGFFGWLGTAPAFFGSPSASGAISGTPEMPNIVLVVSVMFLFIGLTLFVLGDRNRSPGGY